MAANITQQTRGHPRNQAFEQAEPACDRSQSFLTRFVGAEGSSAELWVPTAVLIREERSDPEDREIVLPFVPTGLREPLNFSGIAARYLPLFILPFPRASPFFLIAFLFSITLHAKPCLYCIVMLFALAQSSCYWQPVPASELYSSLISHSSPSISSTPNPLSSTAPAPSSSAASPIDGSVRLIDRCWCDLSFGLGSAAVNFFAPFDVERWEAKSLDRERRIRMKKVDAERAQAGTEDVVESTLVSNETAIQPELSDPATKVDGVPIVAEGKVSGSVLDTAWGRIQSFVRTSSLLPSSASKSDPQPPSSSSTDENVTPAAQEAEETVPSPSPSEVVLPPWSVDLRPYGMGLVLDFGWERAR